MSATSARGGAVPGGGTRAEPAKRCGGAPAPPSGQVGAGARSRRAARPDAAPGDSRRAKEVLVPDAGRRCRPQRPTHDLVEVEQRHRCQRQRRMRGRSGSMGVAARFGATAMAHGVPREVTVADPGQVSDPRRPTHSLVSMERRQCWQRRGRLGASCARARATPIVRPRGASGRGRKGSVAQNRVVDTIDESSSLIAADSLMSGAQSHSWHHGAP